MTLVAPHDSLVDSMTDRSTPNPPAAAPLAPESVMLIKPDGTPTALGWRKMSENLQKPMATREFKGRGGKVFDYVTARQVADRLDRVVGPGNWASDVRIVRGDHPVAVLVGVGIFGVWKWDAGYSNNPEADDETDRSFETEPLKAAVSDGFKRAAVMWGCGRFLYGET